MRIDLKFLENHEKCSKKVFVGDDKCELSNTFFITRGVNDLFQIFSSAFAKEVQYSKYQLNEANSLKLNDILKQIHGKFIAIFSFPL